MASQQHQQQQQQQAQKAQGLPNPYAPSLPNPYAAATVASSAPVKFSEEQAKAEQKKAPAFHNPHTIKRPQAKKAAVVKKPLMPAALPTSADAAPPAPPAQQHGIDWYRSTADDDAAIMEERRQRNWEESQRKKAMKKFQKQFGYWNPQAPHKPERWSNLKAYRASGGYRRKLQGFNDFLRGAADQSAMSRQGSEGHDAPQPVSASKPPAPAAQPGFAPPSSYDPTASVSIGAPVGQSGDDSDARRMPTSQHAYSAVPPPTGFQPPPPEPARAFPPPPSVSDHVPPPPPPPPPPMAVPSPSTTAYHNATISAPPVRYANATISAPPVRFERPDVRMDDGGEEPTYEEERPAKRPKISKAEAMMAKMGYVKGQGLGKNSDGVTTHLEVKIRKAPQGASTLDDYEGTKVKSQQVFDIRGGQRKKEEPGKFGQESCVVVTWGCVDGVDWTANAQRDDGGIRQDMGDVFSNKFGPVEKIQLDEASTDGVVYIHFKSVLSALNAVNRFAEGWQYRDRTIRARYYDERKFHAGMFEH